MMGIRNFVGGFGYGTIYRCGLDAKFYNYLNFNGVNSGMGLDL